MLPLNNDIVIFSHPRTGTKLLANILEGFGYHNHGEWFSLLSARIQGDRAVRRDKFLEPVWSTSENQYIRVAEYNRRLDLYSKKDKNVITIWPESILEFPFILDRFSNYQWICLRRDPWETMLSWYISSKNKNFDGLLTSKPVKFNEDAFRKIFWDYHKTNSLQDWLIKNKQAIPVEFNQLIAGKTPIFGVSYPVNSKDEHTKLEPLVENLEQVTQWYNDLEIKRQMTPNWD